MIASKYPLVMIFGTFDGLHPGHEYFINSARDCGQKLTVVVARDQNARKFRKNLLQHEMTRKKLIKKRFRDVLVVLGDKIDPMKMVKKYRPDLICLGYDQIGFSAVLKKRFPRIPIKRLKSFHPEIYKSSKLKRK